MSQKHCGNCGSSALYLDHVESLADPAELICSDCDTPQGKYKKKPASQPPPTPLNTLHRMHERCLQLEEDIAEIKLMGGLEDYEGELETDIQTLTFSINNIIEEIEEIES